MQLFENEIGDTIHLDYKRETEKEVSHWNVFLNHTHIGYIVQNKSPYRNKGENWNFVGKSGHPNSYAKTKKELIASIF